MNNEHSQQLLSALRRAVHETPGDALLLSGGLDSSLLAALNPRLPAITVVLENWSSRLKPHTSAGCAVCARSEMYPAGCASDLTFAQQVAAYLDLQWHPVEISQSEALQNLGELVSLTQSYDLALLNNITIYTGLKYAQARGWHTVCTGD